MFGAIIRTKGTGQNAPFSFVLILIVIPITK